MRCCDGCTFCILQACVGVDEVALFEDRKHPVSLGMRGAPESLSFPGVQETVLGIGMNDFICEHLGHITSTRYALNAYANFLLRFGTAVMKADVKKYYDLINEVVTANGRKSAFLTSEDLRYLIAGMPSLKNTLTHFKSNNMISFGR